MEFQEKLQVLRKQRGLTQEELAKELYVSQTAISKWESGRGYPSIDSLKELSNFFSVTIDDLLSSEELITAANDENESKKNRKGAGCSDKYFSFAGIDIYFRKLLRFAQNCNKATVNNAKIIHLQNIYLTST